MSDIFSILTTNRNHEKYLNFWLESVLQQKYRPLEVVFVDDCSKDNSWQWIQNNGPRLKDQGITLTCIQNKERHHYGGSLRIAWAAATGSFFGVLDSDDGLAPESVEYIMDLYRKYPHVGYIYTQFNIYDAGMKFKRKGFSCLPKKKTSLLEMGERRVHTFSHWRTFSSRCPKLESIWPVGLKRSVDKYMGYRLEELITGMFTPRACYLYRDGVKGSITRTERYNWREVIKLATSRRSKHGIKVFPVLAAPS